MLVLDDESAILESMRSLLGRWGCEVTAAATVDEARSAVRGPHTDTGPSDR